MHPAPKAVPRLILLLLSCAALESCARDAPLITAPPTTRAFALIDSYASSGAVQLYWNTSNDPGCGDPPCSPPGAEIVEVLLEQSAGPPFKGWSIVSARANSGPDSATIEGLQEARSTGS